MRRLHSIAAVIALAVGMPSAPAQPLVAAARQAGSVGERFDGYLGMASAGSANLRNQVGAVNIRRRSLYIRLAAARGATAQEVGITAGCQLLSRVATGEVYMLADGVWRRRGPGERAPAPDYCR